MKKIVFMVGGMVFASVVAPVSAAPAAGHGAHLNCCPDGSCCIALPKARPDMVAKVKSGELKRARASWWGFDAEDSTECLQAAISSGVPELVIDFTGRPWIVRPLTGVSDQTLIFEYGTELVAKKGEYKGTADIMLSYLNAKNVKLIGPGATMRMHREDYAKPPYVKGEWRHLISICSCKNVVIEGLRLADSGGDAIYVGMKGGRGVPRNITLRDVVCDRNWRNALSVIAVDGMLIEGCSFINTAGTLPEAGIDFEPNRPSESIVNCVVRNCVSDNNRGKAFGINATQSDSTTVPYGIRFENCRASRSKWGWSYTDGRNPKDRYRPWAGGKVEFTDCVFEKCELEGVAVHRRPFSMAELVLKNCRISGNCVKEPQRPDVYLAVSGHHNLGTDGYVFENVDVKQSAEREWLATSDNGAVLPGDITSIRGGVRVTGADGTVRNVVLDDEWSRSRFKSGPADASGVPPPRTAPDFAGMKVRDSAPGAFRPVQLFFLRMSNRCTFYAAKAGEVTFEAFQRTVGKRKPVKGWINVSNSATSANVGRMAVPEAWVTNRLSVAVPAPGFYTMDINMKGNVLGFTGSSVPLAIDTTKATASLYRCDGTLHFPLPEGKRYGLLVSGCGGECVQAELRTPSGEPVWNKVVGANGSWYMSSEGSPCGMWSVKLSEPRRKPYEDALVELCGAGGFLFLDKDRYWR